MSIIKYILPILILSSLCFTSCDEDSFSQVVTIDVPEHDPLPVLNLQVDAGQRRSISALVTNSKGILDPESTYDIPEDAEVTLYRNGTIFGAMAYQSQTLRYEFNHDDPFPGQAGDTYVLEAKIPGFDLVAVPQTMPVQPIISNATYEVEGTIDPEGYRVDELIVDIQDAQAGITNYYGLLLKQVYVDIDGNGDTVSISRNNIGLDSNDPLVSYASRYGLIFTDEGFSGGEYQLRCYTYYSLNEGHTLEVELYQLSKDAFLYDRSLEQYYNAIDNPFAEPVTVHSNVPGGFGVFTVANKTIFEIN